MTVRLTALIALLIALTACATGSIKQRHASKLSTIQIGDSVAEVREKFPDIYPGGQQSTPNGVTIDAWVFEQTGYNIKSDEIETQMIQFYFVEGKLIQWGEPQDWRDREPHIVIENRHY